MDNIIENMMPLLANNEFELFNHKNSSEEMQEYFINSSVSDDYDYSFVKELFEKICKSFQTKDRKKIYNPKPSFSYKINKIKKIPVKTKLILNSIGFHLLEMNIELPYYSCNIGSLNYMEHFLEENATISVNKLLNDPSESIIKINNKKIQYTNCLYVSWNLIFPVCKHDYFYTKHILSFNGRTLSKYYFHIKNDQEMYMQYTCKIRRFPLDEIFFNHPSFPILIQEKIFEFKNMCIPKMKNILELDIIAKNSKSSKYDDMYDEYTSPEEENLKMAERDFLDFFKSYYNKDDHWKIFLYMNIKELVIYF